MTRQFSRGKSPVNTVDIGNPDIATRVRFSRTKLVVGEEVKLHSAPSQNGIEVRVAPNLAIETEPSIKGHRIIHGPAWKYRNRFVAFLHNVFDV